MGLHIRKPDPNKPKPTKHQFSEISGHCSLIDVKAIQKSNEVARKERVLKAATDAVNALGDVVRNHRAKQKAGQILSTEEE